MQKIKSALKFLLLLAVAIGLLFFAFHGISVKTILDEILKANMFWLLASVALSLVAFVSRAYRWNLLLEPVGYQPPLKSTLYAEMVGYFANLAFPRLGEVTRCGALSKAEKIPFNVLLGTVIVERVVDVISLLICILITAVIEYDRLGNFLLDNIFHPAMVKANSYLSSVLFDAVLISLIIAVVIVSVYYRKKRKKAGEESKILKLIRGLMSGLRSIGQLQRPGAFIFHSVLIWAMYWAMAYVAFFCLPMTSELGPGAGLFVLVAGGIGMSAPVQGGIGAYHLLVSQGLMLFGLSQQDGLAFATMLHTSQIIVIILFGSLSLLLLFQGNKKKGLS